MKGLSKEQLDELRSFDTPTVSNAIERFDLRPRTAGFASSVIRAVFPEMPPLVGYACTAKVSASQPPTEAQKELLYRYYQSVLDCPEPTIAVIQDLDEQPIGSFWGEVQATTHKALGCVGAITDGGVRDLDEVRKLGFSYHASSILVSHGYIHLEEVAVPVTIAGLTVRSGDLLHADKHGVVLIPAEIAGELAEACRAAQRAERPILEGCANAPNGRVTVESLRAWREEMTLLRSGKNPKRGVDSTASQ